MPQTATSTPSRPKVSNLSILSLRKEFVPYVEICHRNSDDNRSFPSTFSPRAEGLDDHSDGNPARTRTHTKGRFRTMIFFGQKLPRTITDSRAQYTV
jgi:hypothetical protein